MQKKYYNNLSFNFYVLKFHLLFMCKKLFNYIITCHVGTVIKDSNKLRVQKFLQMGISIICGLGLFMFNEACQPSPQVNNRKA